MSQQTHPLNIASAIRILGADPRKGPEGLKAAYRAAVKRVHPDRPGGDAESLRAVIEAYELLRASAPVFVTPPPERPKPAVTLAISPTEALSGGRHLTRAADGREVYVTLPAGLRAGDLVRIAGELRTVTIASGEGLAVIGDHLCMTVAISAEVLRRGGAVTVTTPLGERAIRITRHDGMRGLVRVVGRGLPPRAGHPRGDLLIRLEASAPVRPAAESVAQSKQRQFNDHWAA